MNRGVVDIMLCACVIATIALLVAIDAINKSSEIKREQMRNEQKLKEYELVTARTEAEAVLIYAKALEVSCSSELVNKWGEVYTR